MSVLPRHLWVLIAGCFLFASITQDGRAEGAGEIAPAPNDARYFVMVFGSESVPKRPRYTHTWATVTKATPDQTNPDSFQFAFKRSRGCLEL